MRGSFYRVNGNIAKAKAAFAKAIALDRINTESYLPYLTYLVQSKQTEIAIPVANYYLSLHIEDSMALAQFGLHLVLLGRVDAGVQHMEQALAIDPGNCVSHEVLATLFISAKLFERAARHIQMLKLLYDQQSFELAIAVIGRSAGIDALESKLAAASEMTLPQPLPRL